jgi:predicted transcriptional regulator
MAKITKTLDIDIVDESGTFTTFFKRITGEHSDYDFEGLSALRHLLSNEKARILNIIKIKKPNSIYRLAKMLKRDFKSVNEDIKLLEKFGFIDLIAQKTGKRERLKPILVVDSVHINLRF